jgi:hypothetical protein
VLNGSAGLFLVFCGADNSDSSTLVLDVATRKVIHVVDLRTAPDDSYLQIGSQWLEGVGDSSGHLTVIYLNWHTGEMRYTGLLQSEPQVPRDLNSPNLRSLGHARTEFVVGSSMVLAQGHAAKRWGRYRIDLVRHSRTKTLAQCFAQCVPVSLKGGLALWLDGPGRLVGYALATGRRLHRTIPNTAYVVGATLKRVYYGTLSPGHPTLRDIHSFVW